MTQNLATKYSAKVDERFKLGSLTAGLTNQDYEWNGVNSIYVYSGPVYLNNPNFKPFSKYDVPYHYQQYLQ